MRKREYHWILAINVVALAIGAYAALPPYTLSQPENSDAKTYPREQLMARLGVTEDDLKPYYCDGRREFELLPEFIHPNAAGDSLRIQGDEQKVYVYQKGALSLNGAPAKSDGSDFMSGLLKTLGELEALPTGKLLLERLEHAPYPITVSAGVPRFTSKNDDGTSAGLASPMAQAIQFLITLRRSDYGEQFTHIGAGGRLYFDRDFDPGDGKIEADGKTRVAKPWVMLAHEMFHAFDSERGMLDRRILDGAAYESSNEVTEFRATYLENKIREESGLKYLKYYGTYTKKELKNPKIVHGSLLGEDGKPFLIPAPCLTGQE